MNPTPSTVYTSNTSITHAIVSQFTFSVSSWAVMLSSTEGG